MRLLILDWHIWLTGAQKMSILCAIQANLIGLEPELYTTALSFGCAIDYKQAYKPTPISSKGGETGVIVFC